MNFKEAVREIESMEFNVRVNVASDLRHLLTIASKEICVGIAFSGLEEENNKKYLINRLINLASRKTDMRYENPYDTALVIFLWLFSYKNEKLARISAQTIIEAPQLWWASSLARQILFGIKINEVAGIKSEELRVRVSDAPVIMAETTGSNGGGESCVFANFNSGVFLSVDLREAKFDNLRADGSISIPGFKKNINSDFETSFASGAAVVTVG